MDFYQIWNFDLTKLAKIAILVLKICQKKKDVIFAISKAWNSQKRTFLPHRVSQIYEFGNVEKDCLN